MQTEYQVTQWIQFISYSWIFEFIAGGFGQIHMVVQPWPKNLSFCASVVLKKHISNIFRKALFYLGLLLANVPQVGIFKTSLYWWESGNSLGLPSETSTFLAWCRLVKLDCGFNLLLQTNNSSRSFRFKFWVEHGIYGIQVETRLLGSFFLGPSVVIPTQGASIDGG